MSSSAGFELTRSRLLLAIAVFVALSVGAFLGSAFTEDTWDPVVLALASAFLSIALALLVTEFALKPVFVRDVLRVAGLRHRIDEIGLQNLSTHSEVPWAELYEGSKEQEVVVTRPRFWMASHLGQIQRAAERRAVQVNIYLPSIESGSAEQVAANLGLDKESYAREVESVARDLEMSWRGYGSKASGATLTIHWLDRPPLHAFARFDGTTVMSLQSVVSKHEGSEHLAIQVRQRGTSDVTSWIEDAWNSVRANANRVPVWTDRRERAGLREPGSDAGGRNESS